MGTVAILVRERGHTLGPDIRIWQNPEHFQFFFTLWKQRKTAITMESLMKIVLFISAVACVYGQESINVGKGMNVGMHAGIALVMCFFILGSCAIGVNILTRVCAKRLTHDWATQPLLKGIATSMNIHLGVQFPL